MATLKIFDPKYESSHALVIGINDYLYASALVHARNDAEEFAQVLRATFGFVDSNITVLLDGTATRAEILRVFLSYASSVSENDRIIVFFAGHGHTVSGRRGETGFLVPVDGNPGDLSTLIRWDELTRNADLIPAKHMLFVMDACYGGLALARGSLSAGTMRFMSDMLQRLSRQVLTAGKADETVSDANGPRPGHSIFTGHLLDALEGRAASEGVITASGVMAYVYEKVAKDQYSKQTPHHGFVDGDGDFIFNADVLTTAESSEPKELPVKIATYSAPSLPGSNSTAEMFKELLSAPSQQIRLDDFVSQSVRTVLEATNVARFPVQGVGANKEEFASRVTSYEAAVTDIATMAILMGRWCTPTQIPILEKTLGRLAEGEKGSAGNAFWLSLAGTPRCT